MGTALNKFDEMEPPQITPWSSSRTSTAFARARDVGRPIATHDEARALYQLS